MMDNLNEDQVSVTRNASTDLAWDYSANEASPLLSGGVGNLQRSTRKLSNRQLAYLIDNLDEVGRVLKGQIPSTSNPASPKCQSFKRFVFAIPFIFSILHVSALITDSLLISEWYYFTYVSTSFNTILLLIFQVDMVICSRRQIPPLLPLTTSTTLLTFLFASFYTIANKEATPYWPTYLRSVHSSISVATLNYYGQFQQDNVWVLILLTIQMVASLIHLLLILATLTGYPFDFASCPFVQEAHLLRISFSIYITQDSVNLYSALYNTYFVFMQRIFRVLDL